MPIEFQLNDAVNNDQTDGLQSGQDPDFDDPNNLKTDDTDVTFASLDDSGLADPKTADFYNRLNSLYGSLLDEATDFAIDTGAASELGSVTATASDGGSLISLGFSGDATGGTPLALSPYSAGWAAGGLTGLETVDGEEIRLFIDEESGLGDQMVLGIDENGDVAFAVYMVPNIASDGLSASVDLHIVSFQALAHPVAGDGTVDVGEGDYVDDHDDEVDLAQYLTISATENVVLNFDGTPPGKNLFTIILRDGSNVETFIDDGKEYVDGSAVVITPFTEVIQLNTSSGGGPTTLALYDQHIGNNKDLIETMVFTFVTNPLYDSVVDPNVNQNLDQNEADLETNIQFQGLDTITGGSVIISQQVSGATASLRLTACDTTSTTETDANGFILGYGDDKVASISLVTVYDETGAAVATWTLTGDAGLGYEATGTTVDGVTVDFVLVPGPDGGYVVEVSGFDDDYEIEYDAAAHQRIKVAGLSGKFDIGGLGIDQPGGSFVTVGQNVVWDDDGPSAYLATTAARITVDESYNFETADSPIDDTGSGDLAVATVSIASLFDTTEGTATVEDFGTDGPLDADDPEDGTDDDAFDFELVLVGGDGTASGLFDTATGQQIYLYENGTTIEGRVGSSGSADVSGAVAFIISIANDPDNEVTVTQKRAVVHDDEDDPDEDGAGEPSVMKNGIVLVQVTLTDDDGDTDSATAELGSRIDWQDDGPSLTLTRKAATLPIDESYFNEEASGPNDDSGSPGFLAQATINAVDYLGTNTANYGNDGMADTTPDVWAFVDPDGADSGLVDTATNDPVVLTLESGDIVGRTSGGDEVIRFSIDGSGNVTVTQKRAVVHNDPDDPDEDNADGLDDSIPANDSLDDPALLNDYSVQVSRKITDGDGDSDTKTVDISNVFELQDDGPSLTLTRKPATLAIDESYNFGTSDLPIDDTGSGALAQATINASQYLVDTTDLSYGNDGAATSTPDVWAFVDPGGDPSGLVDTATNQAVLLSLDGSGTDAGDIVGLTETSGEEVIRFSIDGSGNVTVTQKRAVVHEDGTDPDEDGPGEPAVLIAGSVQVSRKITDGDGDSVTKTVDISNVFELQDDGPTASASGTGVTLTHDESPDEQNNKPDNSPFEDNDDDDLPLFSIPTAFSDLGAALGWAKSDGAVVTSTGSVYGNDGAAGSDPICWELSLDDASDVDSGFRTLDDKKILLNVEGDLVVGRIEATGVVAIAFAIDKDDGELSLAQYVPIKHPTTDPDEAIRMPTGEGDTPDDDILFAKLTVKDGDNDTDTAMYGIDHLIYIEDDGPELAFGADIEVEEDDVDPVGNDEDGSGTNDSVTYTFDFTGANAISGTDAPIQFDFKQLSQTELNSTLATLLSRGEALTYVYDDEDSSTATNDPNKINAYADYGGSGERLVLDLTLAETTTNKANLTLTVHDDIDHVIEAGNGTENTLLQVDSTGNGLPDTTASGLLVSVIFDFTDADGDPVPVDDLQFVLEDDVPLFEGGIVDGFVEFSSTTSNTVTEDLNGSVGTDQTDGNNESQQGNKTYTFTHADPNTTINETSIDNLIAKYSFDGDWGDDNDGVQENTRIIYYVDSGDGAGGAPDGVAQQDEVYFDIVLGDQGDDGNYTFTVYKDAPEVFTPFDFTDLPSGQNLHGTIAKNKEDPGEGGLLVFPEAIDLDGDGEFTNISQTTNTSKGGGPVTIGNSNQMFDPGEGHFFAYVDNPVDASIAGVGLNQNNADDADTVGFDGTNEVRIAEFEIVQVQGNKLAKVLIQAWDMNIQAVGDDPLSSEDPVGTGAGELDPRVFLHDPDTGAADRSIDIVKVYLTADLEADRDNAEPLYQKSRVPDASDDDPNGYITFLDDGSGDVTVGGLNDDYTVQFETAGDHDLALIQGVEGKYDIGGFNTLAINETPDQLFDYEVRITDFDEDNATDTFSVEVDGTGQFDGMNV